MKAIAKTLSRKSVTVTIAATASAAGFVGIAARSDAKESVCGLCVVAASGTSLKVSGTGSILSGQRIDVASTSPGAVSLSGTAKITTSVVRSVGTIDRSGASAISGLVQPNLRYLQVQDPFATRETLGALSWSTGTTDIKTSSSRTITSRADNSYRDITAEGASTVTFPENHRYRNVVIAGTSNVTLKPGDYQSIKIEGSARVQLTAGVYTVGNFKVSDTAQVSGPSAALVFRATSESQEFKAEGSSKITLGASGGSQPLRSENVAVSMRLSGTSSVTLTGGIDAASANLRLEGSSQLLADTSLLIASVEVSGTAKLQSKKSDPTIPPIPTTSTKPPTTTTTLPPTTTTTKPPTTTSTSTTTTTATVPPVPVKPLFECVVKHDGQTDAYFGYEVLPVNGNLAGVTVPVGQQNRLSRDLVGFALRDQFVPPGILTQAPGRTSPGAFGPKAFIVSNWDGQPLSWTLGNQTVSVDANKVCADSPFSASLSDAEGDKLPDAFEIALGSNPNSSDTDADGLNDLFEWNAIGTLSLNKADSDGDGLSDLLEDSDGDGLTNEVEATFGGSPVADDGDIDGVKDPQEKLLGTNGSDSDSDDDSLEDGLEVRVGLNPARADSDNDGIRDDNDQVTLTASYGTTTVSILNSPSARIFVQPTFHKLPGSMTEPVYVGIENGTDGPGTVTAQLIGAPGAASKLRVFSFDEDLNMWYPTETVPTVNGNIVTYTAPHFSPTAVADISVFLESLARTDKCTDLGTVQLVLDTSGSMQSAFGRSPFYRSASVRKFLGGILGRSNTYGLIDLDGTADQTVALTTDKTRIDAGVKRLDQFGGSNYPQALRFAYESLRSLDPKKPRSIVLITAGDGLTPAMIAEARVPGVSLFIVAPTFSANQLKKVPIQLDGGRIFSFDQPIDLESIDVRQIFLDSDGDHVSDCAEINGYSPANAPDRVIKNSDPFVDGDDDGDNLTTSQEVYRLATKADFAEKGIKDVNREIYLVDSFPDDVDSDSDTPGATDNDEYGHDTDPFVSDPDGDNVPDEKEFELETDPLESNTDGDRYSEEDEADGLSRKNTAIFSGLNIDSEEIFVDPTTWDQYLPSMATSIVWVTQGFICGDATVPYVCEEVDQDETWFRLLGTIISGVYVYGDVRDIVVSAARHDDAQVLLGIAQLAPGIGDALGAGNATVKYLKRFANTAQILYPLIANMAADEDIAAAEGAKPGSRFSKLAAWALTHTDEFRLLKNKLITAGFDSPFLLKLIRGGRSFDPKGFARFLRHAVLTPRVASLRNNMATQTGPFWRRFQSAVLAHCGPVCRATNFHLEARKIDLQNSMDLLALQGKVPEVRLGDGTRAKFADIFGPDAICDMAKNMKSRRDFDAYDDGRGGLGKRSLEAKTGRHRFRYIQLQACADLLLWNTDEIHPTWFFTNGITGNIQDNGAVSDFFETLKIAVRFEL